MLGNNSKACLMLGTDCHKGSKRESPKMDVTFEKPLLSGGPLLSGIARKVQKLTLLSGSRYFRRAATLGTLR